MIRDIRIYTKNDIIMIKDIYEYHIYTKAKTLEILTQQDYLKKYDLEQITQIDIATRLENKNYATYTDTILF